MRPGELTFGWRITVALTWAAAFFGYAAVWNTSVELGLSTWWLGPRSAPNPTVIRILPFVLPLVMALAAAYGVRRLPLLGLAASALTALIGVFDLTRASGIAAIELLISAATAAVSAAALSGRYRAAPPDAARRAPAREFSGGGGAAAASAGRAAVVDWTTIPPDPSTVAESPQPQ